MREVPQDTSKMNGATTECKWLWNKCSCCQCGPSLLLAWCSTRGWDQWSFWNAFASINPPLTHKLLVGTSLWLKPEGNYNECSLSVGFLSTKAHWCCIPFKPYKDTVKWVNVRLRGKYLYNLGKTKQENFSKDVIKGNTKVAIIPFLSIFNSKIQINCIFWHDGVHTTLPHLWFSPPHSFHRKPKESSFVWNCYQFCSWSFIKYDGTIKLFL